MIQAMQAIVIPGNNNYAFPYVFGALTVNVTFQAPSIRLFVQIIRTDNSAPAQQILYAPIGGMCCAEE
jgi:hypothetical protein